MCIATTTNITPIVAALGGAMVGGLCSLGVGYFLSQRNHTNALALMDRQEAHKAFLALEASHVPMLRILRESGAKDRQKIPTFFDSQDIAMLSFVWHLTGENRSNFEAKWAEYDEWRKEYAEYESRQENSSILLTSENKRGALIELIEAILEAAKKY